MKASTTHATDDNADQLSLPLTSQVSRFTTFSVLFVLWSQTPFLEQISIFFPSVCIVCCALSPMKQLSNNYYRTPTKRNGPSDENILDLESTTYKFFFIQFKLSVRLIIVATRWFWFFCHYIEILKSSVYSNLNWRLVEAQHSCSLSRGCRVFFISNLKIEKKTSTHVDTCD